MWWWWWFLGVLIESDRLLVASGLWLPLFQMGRWPVLFKGALDALWPSKLGMPKEQRVHAWDFSIPCLALPDCPA